MRRIGPMRFKSRLQTYKCIGRKMCLFNLLQNRSKQIEIVGCIFYFADGLLHAGTEPVCDRQIQQAHAECSGPPVPERPTGKAQYPTKGQQRQCDAQNLFRANPGCRFTPGDQRLRMYADANIFSSQRKAFAKVVLRREFLHGGVPLLYFLDGSMSAQPLCKFVFARTRASGAQQLKQAALPKEIEVARVWVRSIQEGFTLLSGSGPAVFQP